jgi:O-antigen/teichoic acid export membrane protein
MTAARRSFLLSFADSYLTVMLQLASTVIVARLLSPAEVGVYAIAAVFSALASMFRDFGVGEYLIQVRTLDAQRIRAAFGMNIIVSWTMAVALVVLAAPAAAFYREPGVGDVMRVLAISFVVLPIGAVVQSCFRRDLNYKPLVICNALSSITSFVVVVWMAYHGYGTMSLAWSTVAGIVVTVLATMYFRPADFPRWPSFRGLREVFDFGKYASGIYVMVQLGKGAPEMVIGRVSGAADVGLYSRASSLVELFRRLVLRPVMMVCLPVFAKASREQGSVADSYVRSVALVTAVGWPFLAFFALAAFAVIRIIYGTQWMAAVPVAQVLCLACAIELLYILSREALLAVGAVKQASLLQLQIVLLQLLGLTLAVTHGLEGAAWGLVLAAVGAVVLAMRALRIHTGLKVRPFVRGVAPSAALTAIAIALPSLLMWWQPLGESNYLLWSAAGSSLLAASWLAALRGLNHPLWHELQQIVRPLLNKLRSR